VNDSKVHSICESDEQRQAAIVLSKLMLHSLAKPNTQEEFEAAIKWKNSWRGIVSQCLLFRSNLEYDNCMKVNIRRFTSIFISQYPKADLQADSEKLRIQALDKIKQLVAESKKHSDDCLAEVIRKTDDGISEPIEVGRIAFTNCRSKIHAYMRAASDTYIVDDFLIPSALATDESLAITEEHIYTNGMLSQLVVDMRAKSASSSPKRIKTKKSKVRN